MCAKYPEAIIKHLYVNVMQKLSFRIEFTLKFTLYVVVTVYV